VPPSISVCLIVKNEARLLAHCLNSVSALAAEIIVVDTGSTDGTPAIARRLGARVIEIRWTDYATARNRSIAEATCQWILVLDGDESIAARDLPRIRRLVRFGRAAGYRLLVRNYSDEYDLLWRWSPNDRRYVREERFSKCEGWMKTQALRLFRNQPGVAYPMGPGAHPTVAESIERAGGRIGDRDDIVIHHFQCLKGGPGFLARKQRDRLPSEIRQIRVGTHDPSTILNAAKTLFSEGRDRHARALLAQLTRRHPTFADGYQLRAMIAFETGHFRSAEHAVRRALSITPRSADAWCLLGMILVEAGRPGPAIDSLRRAIRHHAGHLLAHNSLGVAYADLGRERDARRAFSAALRLHRRFQPAIDNLASLSTPGRTGSR
jgi:tetratricopeptide (TPR) repeat protein